MDKSTNGEARPGEAERPQESGVAAPGRGGRMSRQRKAAAVLRESGALEVDSLGTTHLHARLHHPQPDRGEGASEGDK